MENKEHDKTGLVVSAILLLITLIVTIWLFYYLTEPQKRSETFGFTLAFVCFLEVISFGYFITLTIPSFKEKIVAGLYPSIGIIIGFYVAVSLIIIFLFNIIVNSPETYFIFVIVESLIFLLLFGVLVVINAQKKSEDITIHEERKGLIDLSVSVQKIHQNFLNSKNSMDLEIYREIEPMMRKLKERFQFCTPFGHSNTTSLLEQEIKQKIDRLSTLVEILPAGTKSTANTLTVEVKHITDVILQSMERRERLLLK